MIWLLTRIYRHCCLNGESVWNSTTFLITTGGTMVVTSWSTSMVVGATLRYISFWEFSHLGPSNQSIHFSNRMSDRDGMMSWTTHIRSRKWSQPSQPQHWSQRAYHIALCGICDGGNYFRCMSRYGDGGNLKCFPCRTILYKNGTNIY